MKKLLKSGAAALLAGMVLMAAVGISDAAVPSSITYQGKLTDTAGNPVPDGSRAMTFRLYDSQSGGTLLWNSGAMNVVTTGGVFSSALGASPTPPLTASVFASGNVWLEVQIGTEAPLPRVKLHSAPYALRAEVAESVPDSSITSAKIADGTITFADIGQNSASANQVIKRNSTNTAWVAAPDNDTTYSAGTGLSLDGTTFSLNTSYVDQNYWSQGGNSGTNPSVDFIGTTDANALEIKVNSNRALRIEPTSSVPNVVGGYVSNEAASGVMGAFVGGGGNPDDGGSRKFNKVYDHFGTIGGGVGNTAGSNNGVVDDARHATVGGGQYNEATGSISTVGGGWYNRATYERATVGGGWNNLASQHAATVGGGRDNVASGTSSTVPGGASNRAQGNYSFAAGQRAKADHQGTFVWADSTAADFTSTANNQFLVRASGGVGIGTASPGAALDVNGVARVLGSTFPGSGQGLELGYDSSLNRGYVQAYNRTSSAWGSLYLGDGTVGIGVSSPEAKLHVLGASGKAIYGKANNALAQVGYGVYGEASYTDGRGVYGLNVTNNSYGYLGGSDRGVHGQSSGGNYGYLGSTDRGAHGQSSAGHYGYLGGSDRGAYGRHSGGNAGSLGGSDYGVKSEGDLIVTGAFKGSIGPNNGAPFPRPAYDSGWVVLAEGSSTILTHNIGINTDKYVVDLQMRDTSYYGTTNVHIGGNAVWDEGYGENSWRGAYWSNLTTTTIKVTNNTQSGLDSVRIRIWVYN